MRKLSAMSSERCPSCRRNAVRHHSGITVRHGPERATFQRATQRSGDAALLSRDMHAGVCGAVAAITAVDEAALGFCAGAPTIKLFSLSHGETHLDTELVFVVRFPFRDAFNFRRMHTVELVVIVTLLRE
jgi:hypothetical protein